MTIFVDVDDILAAFTKAFLVRLNAANGTSYTYEDHKDYGFSCVMPSNQSWQAHTADKLFWMGLPTHPWAHDLMEAVWASGWDYAYLSAVPFGAAFDGRRVWLDALFQDGTGDKPHERLIVAERKDLVVRPGDILIEDSPHHIEACRRIGATVLAMSHPWNQNVEGLLSPEQIISEIRAL